MALGGSPHLVVALAGVLYGRIMTCHGFSGVIVAAMVAMVLLALPARAQESGQWFDVDAVNPGLGQVPADVDRSTPQGAVESFLAAIRRGDSAAAAHLLDLTAIAREEQTSEGPTLARKLSGVIERRLWIDWSDLPDRPDAVFETGSDSNPLAGQARRSLRLSILDLDDRPVSLRLSRLKPKDGDPVWVFARQTVANIEALHLRYGPGWFESQLPPQWQTRSYFSLRKWELVALPVLVALAGVIFVLCRWLLGMLANRARWDTAQNAARAARTPLALFASAVILDYMATEAISFSAPITSVLSPVLVTAMAVAVTLAILKAIDSLLDVVTHRYVGEIDDEQSAEERSFYTSIYALRADRPSGRRRARRRRRPVAASSV